MAGERRAAGASDPPRPDGVRTVEELTERLRQLRAWSGLSYRAVHREVVRLRAAQGVPERPVYNTVYRCFQVDRIRLDVELVVDIAHVLLGDEAAAVAWRQACQVIQGAAGAAHIVDVTDRLPEESGTFVGRREEIRQLVEYPATPVIDGMAGVGKTRLAVHVARRAAADVCLSVDLRGFDPDRPPADPGAVLDGFLRCLGLSGDAIARLDLAGRTAAFRKLLTGRRAVVLLDNAATVEQIRPLLPASPQCTALVTSRHRLEIPGARHISLSEFTPSEVAEFLRAERIDAPDEQAWEIGRLVAHLPLALTIAAARIQSSPEWTVADHLDRLEQQRRSLRLDPGLESALALSYEDLPTEVRRTFLLLVLHPGTDLERYATAALADLDLGIAEQHLNHLQSANLLQQKSPGRYTFHDLIRVFATNRATDEVAASTRRAALNRLFEYYEYAASLAMDAYAPHEKDRRPEIAATSTPVPQFADRPDAMTWLESERHNLIAAAQNSVDSGSSSHAYRQSETLFRYLETAGQLRDSELLNDLALRTADPPGTVRVMNNLGGIYRRIQLVDATP